MAQFHICVSNTSCGVYSFTTGYIPSPEPKIKNDEDVLALALWLEHQGREEESWELLERYCK